MRKIVLLTLALLANVVSFAGERIDMPLTADSAAMLYIFRADAPSGLAVISCPGGAYANHAMGHEGFDFADWYNSRGIDYAVLKYRLPHGQYTVPAEDGFKAISIMKGIAPKVGVMGFSAGGHLASTLATHYPDSVSRPDFQILFYPVISMAKEKTHSYSRKMLLGDNPSEELVHLYSNETQITPDTPPALIFHSADDEAVLPINALDYCAALSKNKVAVDMMIFPTGGHGWGFSDSNVSKKEWTAKLDSWLTDLKKSFNLAPKKASKKYEWPSDPEVLAKLEDWQDRKLGIMFHWGVYSIPGIMESWALCSEDGWFANSRRIARPDLPDYGEFKEWYWGLADQFNPTDFDPYKWAEFFKDNGFKYLIFTTKHHDGFCMFDTKQTDYKVTNTPYKYGKYANIAYYLFDAFRDKDFMVGAYYSKPDWHSEYYWDPFYSTPTRWPNYSIEKHPEKWAKFREFVSAQIDELMSDYGRMDILWLDGGFIRKPNADLHMDSIVDAARIKQPGLLAVDRTVHGRNENYQTPENKIPPAQQDFPWESCLTLAGGWGWKPNSAYKSANWIINTLAEIVAKGGCMALNVGPDKNGNFDPEVYERLSTAGEWLKRNGEAIYSTRITPNYNSGNTWFSASKDGKTLYAVYAIDEDGTLPSSIEWEGNIPAGRLRMLNTGKNVKYTVKDNKVTVYLPEGTTAEPLAFKFKARD